MAKSSTNKPTPFDGTLSVIVERGLYGSMTELRKEVKQDQYRIENAVSQFFDLFAAMALDTAAAPALDAYTPTYAALSSSYASKKPSGAGFFKNTGTLISDVESLDGQTRNLLGKSSYVINQTNRGAKKGFQIDRLDPLRVRNSKGNFANPVTSLKNFKVEVVHTPFEKVKGNNSPKDLEKAVFKGAYDDIYNKLTNQQDKGKNNPYRPAFYSFMQWWLNNHLREVIR